MRITTLMVLLIATPALAATVWKWRDADGVVHYSDQPVQGAQKVDIGVASTYHQDPLPTSTPRAAATNAGVIDYSVQIVSPVSEETFANTFQVNISIAVSPALSGDDQLRLYVDGQSVSGFPPQATSYTLNEISRGEHSVAAAVVNAQGATLKRSDAVRFYVTQPSVRGK